MKIDFNDEISLLSSQTSSINCDFIALFIAKFALIALNLAVEFGTLGIHYKEAKGVVSKLSIDSWAEFWWLLLLFSK